MGSARVAMELEEKLEKAKETCPKDKTTVSCLLFCLCFGGFYPFCFVA